MTVVDDSVSAEIRAVLVDFGVPIEEADELASDHPVTAELVPVRLLLDELDVDEVRSRLRLASVVVRDELGLSCVPGPLVKAILEARDRRVAEALAQSRARVLAQRNARQRRQPTRADLQRQLDALMLDDEISEHFQAAFVESLMEQIARLEEGPQLPEVVGGGGFFVAGSDEDLAEIERAKRRERREMMWGRRRG